MFGRDLRRYKLIEAGNQTESGDRVPFILALNMVVKISSNMASMLLGNWAHPVVNVRYRPGIDRGLFTNTNEECNQIDH